MKGKGGEGVQADKMQLNEWEQQQLRSQWQLENGL